jgi:hypothetical protein
MPLTPFQKEVARILMANRSPDSHIAGGAVINRQETSLRYSDDLDIFHDTAASVAASAETDAKALQSLGYSVEWTIRNDGHFRAEVGRGSDHVRLDWTADSAFRFFPVQEDEEFGYCLHQADLATNKVLALAGRSELRDFLDILQLDHDYLSLGAIMWAACGKDAGYTPDLLLDLTNRHARYQESDLKAENLARVVDFQELKRQWLAARQRAERFFALLPSEDLGCLYLDQENRPVTPDPSSPDFAAMRRHKGSVRGSWPRIT